MREKDKAQSDTSAPARTWAGPLAWFIACIVTYGVFVLAGTLPAPQGNIFIVLMHIFMFLVIVSLSAIPALGAVWLIKALHLPRGWSETIAGAAIGPLAYLFMTRGDFSAMRSDTTTADIAQIFINFALIGALAGFIYWLAQWLLNLKANNG